MAGIDQAGDRPDYVQGALGYGQRFGAEYTDSFVNIMIGGGHSPFRAPPGPALLLSGLRHHEVLRAPCGLLPVHLHGRQRTLAAELFEHWR